MRLISVELNNFRIHNQIKIDFDPSITIIKGPNESGKSTLVEAIHRAFFLKYKIGGSILKRMQSRLSSGNPRVLVKFEISGRKCILEKIFAGPSGSIHLRVDGKSFSGDEAERQLATLIGEEPLSGRAEKSINQKWQHLWVWQGKSGDSITNVLEGQSEKLIKRLQEEGSAMIFQSDWDNEVFKIIKERYDTYFTSTGRVRSGSTLAKLKEEYSKAKLAYEQALSRLQKLSDARRHYLLAKEDKKQAQNNLNQNKKELERVKKQLKEADNLEKQLDDLRSKEKELSKQHKKLKELLNDIINIEAKLQDSEKEIKPLEQEKELVENKLKSLTAQMDQLEKRIEALENDLIEKMATRNWAQAQISLLDKKRQITDLKRRKERLDTLKNKLAEKRKRLAGLPKITKKLKKEIEINSRKYIEAKAACDAMAAEIEVLKANCYIEVNNKKILPGEKRLLTEEALIRIGDEVELTLRPGGGDALAKARERVRDLEKNMKWLLEKAGVTTVEEALVVFEKRNKIEEDLERITEEIDVLEPNMLIKQLEILQEELNSEQARLERFSKKANRKLEDPFDTNQLNDFSTEISDEISKIEFDKKRAEEELKQFRRQKERGQQKIADLNKKIHKISNEIASAKAKLDVKLEEAGSKEALINKINSISSNIQIYKERIKQLEKKLHQLGVDLLKQNEERLKKAIENNNLAILEAGKKLGGAEALLRKDGSVDLKEEMEKAKARFESVKKQLELEKIKAEGLKLLVKLFQEERENIEKRYSKPFIEKINNYLNFIFRGKKQVMARIRPNGIDKVVLMDLNSNAEFPFEDLSGGTKEQVAAAIRLAAAELLAKEHKDKCLPIIFDDAFTNTDSKRRPAVHGMLFNASKNGLQLIVLTSNPEDYSGIGARSISLLSPTNTLQGQSDEQLYL